MHISILSFHEFDAETATSGAQRVVKTRLENDLATASSGKRKLDNDPETWHRLAVDMRLPPNKKLLLLRAVEAR